jgi:hypothetical protein
MSTFNAALKTTYNRRAEELCKKCAAANTASSPSEGRTTGVTRNAGTLLLLSNFRCKFGTRQQKRCVVLDNLPVILFDKSLFMLISFRNYHYIGAIAHCGPWYVSRIYLPAFRTFFYILLDF